mmetsp:Transcript_39730/g.71639  ORF Transcript_39730/g.71639 Transcript_39730/m.71639 type:complete len:301 (+) Transcript_39730:309-1211(+)
MSQEQDLDDSDNYAGQHQHQHQHQIILAAVAATLLLLCTYLSTNAPTAYIHHDPQSTTSSPLQKNLRRTLLSLSFHDPKSQIAKVYPNFEAQFLDAARSFRPTTDKVTTHSYQIMYGQFLLPFYLQKPNMKMLEIGLGCNMRYGPGASVSLWKHLFPGAELWEAEYDGNCVEKSMAEGSLEGIHPLVGDQNDVPTLDTWIDQSGGADFDVVIDDGGHEQCQIWTSFQKLWPKVQPGGLYFIEDLQVSRKPKFNQVSSPLCEKGTNVVDNLKDMIDDLAHDVMTDIKFVFCQRESCVLGKK